LRPSKFLGEREAIAIVYKAPPQANFFVGIEPPLFLRKRQKFVEAIRFLITEPQLSPKAKDGNLLKLNTKSREAAFESF